MNIKQTLVFIKINIRVVLDPEYNVPDNQADGINKDLPTLTGPYLKIFQRLLFAGL